MFADTIVRNLRRKLWKESLSLSPVASAVIEFVARRATDEELAQAVSVARDALLANQLSSTASSRRRWTEAAAVMADAIARSDDGELTDLFAAELHAFDAGDPHGLCLTQDVANREDLRRLARRVQTTFAAVSVVGGCCLARNAVLVPA